MARYLVTGGAGFIGSHLVDALISDGHSVSVFDDLSTGKLDNLPRGIELVTADVTDQEAVRRALTDMDGCFHLAAIASVECGSGEWLRRHRVNLAGTIAIFTEALRAQKQQGRPVPVVYASSAAVYGNLDADPVQEDAVPRPISAYGVDKLACELHAEVAANLYDLQTVGLRFFNIYGPRQEPNSPYSGVISKFCRQILQGAPVEIHGDGNQVRDFVYVQDAVAALQQAMDAVGQSPQIYNVCTGIGTRIGHLGAMIAHLRGITYSPRYTPARDGDVRVSLGDPRKARDGLRFSATTLLEQGLVQTIEAMVHTRAELGATDVVIRAGGD